ncbi:hypothetical protein ASZ78_008001 [Callipepla squamata]|uniref:Uncharacterized protein n=1 Tax=Callipepla squamata TaxID=9009 RepID=A0A226MEG5_CALSU|nr:hypothetical protein ASZ78_008001 [Callipepla squamata]
MASGPTHLLAWQAHRRPLGQPSGAPGLAVKALTAVPLFSPACVLCGKVDDVSGILGIINGLNGFYFHMCCVMISLEAHAIFLPPMVPFFMPLQDHAHSSRRRVCLFFNKKTAGVFVFPDETSYAQLIRQSRRLQYPCVTHGPQHHWEAGIGDRVEEEGRYGLVLILVQLVLTTFPPFSDRPEWEDNDAYASLHERHMRCDAQKCRFQSGREWFQRLG